MNKKISLLILCLVAYFNTFSQDIIEQKDGKKLEVIIKKVTKKTITYTFFDDPNNVLHSIDKVLVANIEFSYGQKNIDLKDPEKNPYYFMDDKIQNVLFNFSALGGNTFAVAYERVLRPGQSIMTELKLYGLGVLALSEKERSGVGLDVSYRLKTQSFFNKNKYRPKHLLHGPYFAPVVGLSSGSMTYYGFDDNYDRIPKKNKHTILHLGIQYGNQWILYRKLSVDASFGFHYYRGKQSNEDEGAPLRLGNMLGSDNKLVSFNVRVGFLTGKQTYKAKKKSL